MTVTTRKQSHVADVEPTMHGLTEALAQLAISGVPPDASVAVTSHNHNWPGSRLLVAVDWTVSE